MSGTPRMRSGFPSTPDNTQRNARPRGTPPPAGRILKSALPSLPTGAPALASTDAPLIPVELIDAPSQRLYVTAFYGLLLVWRLYDWWTLIEDESESFLLFMKWVLIDGMFVYWIPKLRIPWLEWSDTAAHVAFFLHAGLNAMLMFRVPVGTIRFPAGDYN